MTTTSSHPTSAKPERSRARRIVVGLAKVVVGLVVVVIVLVTSVIVLLDTDPGRRQACAFATDLVNASIKGTLHIGKCARLSPSYLRIERVELRDPANRKVVTVGSVTVRPDLWRLLRGKIAVHQVDVVTPSVNLSEHGEQLDLLVAVESRVPSTGPSSDPPNFVVERVRLRRGRVYSLPEGLSVQRLAIDLGVGFDEHFNVGVGSVSANFERLGKEVARLRNTSADVQLRPGARSKLAATLTSGTDRIDVAAHTGWTDAGPGPLDGRLSFTISPALLTRFGQDDAARSMAAPISGSLHAAGTFDDLAGDGRIDTAGGTVQLTARRQGERVEARVWTASLALGRVLTDIQAHVAGDVSGALGAPAAGTGVRSVDVSLTDIHYDDYSLPRLTAQGTLGENEAHLTELSIPHLTGERGHLDVDARVGFDGGGELRLDALLPQLAADANVRRLAPGVRAGIEARLNASLTAAGHLDAQGHIRLDEAATSAARARQLDIEGWARGALATPVVNLRIDGHAIEAGGETVQDLALFLKGGPSSYRLAGKLALAPAGRRTLTLDIGAVAEAGRYEIDGRARVTGLWSAPLDVWLRDIVIDPSSYVKVGALRVHGAELRVNAAGIVRFEGPSSMDVQVRGLDLARVDRFFRLQQGLAGDAQADLHLRGTLQDPDVVVSAVLARGRVKSVTIPEANLEAHLDARGGSLSSTTRLDLGSFGRLAARLQGTFPQNRRSLVDRLKAGTWEAGLEGHEVSPALARAIDPTAPEIEGKLELRFVGRGTEDDPRMRLEVSARGLTTAGVPPLAVDAALDVGPEGVAVTAAAADDRGRLGSVEASTTAKLAEISRARGVDALLGLPWQVSLSTADRRLDSLPAPLRSDIPVRARMGATIRGGPRPMEADIHVVLVPVDLAVYGDQGCASGVPPEIAIDVSLRNGETHVTAHGQVRGAQVLEASVTAPTPVDQWLRTGMPTSLPAVTATVRAAAVPLAAVPGVCTRATGSMDLTIEGARLFTDAATLDLRAKVQNLRVGEAAPSNVELTAALTGALATVRASLDTAGRRTMSLEGRLPVTWGGAVIVPTLREEPWTADLRVSHAPVGPLLVAVPGIEQPTGALDGRLALRGTGARWAADGSLALERVSFILTDPLVRIDDLRGRLRFAPGAIRFDDMSLRDGDGRLRASGRVAFVDGAPRDVRIKVRTTDYPLRIDGVVFAFVDTVTEVTAQLGETATRARVALRDTAVRLPEQSGRTVQKLDQHPDLVYEDQPEFADVAALRRDRDAAEPVVVAPVEDDGTTMRIDIDATRPLWVRRNDFAVQLTADLQIDRARGVTQIVGPIRVRRGFIQLLGKTFTTERGEIRFDGGVEVNPIIRMKAVHTLASRETVTVNIDGRLQKPQLTFTTTVPGVVTEREILELLVRGRGGAPETAEDQAVSMLSGLTAGLVSSLTRRELGEYLPVLGIESSTSGGTRVHAGLEADRIIPRGLRRVVQGAYVEGIWGTGGSDSTGAAGDEGSGGSRGGFLIELYLPRDLVTSGTFAEPDNWSVDLSWEP